MRFFILSLVLACSLTSSAQTHFGLKVSPTLSLNKATGNNLSTNGAGIRYNFGIWGEFTKSESSNVSFYTGVFYANKRIGTTYDNGVIKSKSVTDLQYFQVPIALKFISDEIFNKARIYVLLGVTNDFNVSEHTVTTYTDRESSTNFYLYDINFLAGLGLEYKLSENNSLVLGISHTRGLTNVFKNKHDEEYEIKSRIFALDLGVKF